MSARHEPTATQPRLLLPRALEIGEELVAALIEHAGQGGQVLLAGSARRRADSVKDLDVIAVTSARRRWRRRWPSSS